MQNKKVAILQSNYIPWKGYFDIIGLVDEFIFYDEMQYTTNDWRNRNKIKTKCGLQWLTIPVNSNNHLNTKINETTIARDNWHKKHINALTLNYASAEYFKKYKDYFLGIYEDLKEEHLLCNVNYKFIIAINELLGIKTKISFDKDYGLCEGKTERLVDLVLKANGTEYLSGPSAGNYIDKKLFEEANIKLSWMDYSDYKDYPQLYPPFNHYVSILDLIFNCGPSAKRYMKIGGV